VIEDYPRNLMELEGAFSTEAACRDYLARLRWPDGFRCPHCGGGKSWPVRGVLFQCAVCGRQTSVIAGTIFQDTRTPLPVWFRAMWWVTTQKNGASALGLQRVLGLKSYETAWAWLHKLRRAMVRPGRDMLTGRVEVDECYVGGPEDGLVGRLNLDKALVVVAAQEDGAGIGRIRLHQIADASADSLVPFVRESVESGSTVHTDGWLGYRNAAKEQFRAHLDGILPPEVQSAGSSNLEKFVEAHADDPRIQEIFTTWAKEDDAIGRVLSMYRTRSTRRIEDSHAQVAHDICCHIEERGIHRILIETAAAACSTRSKDPGLEASRDLHYPPKIQ
jgi:hypothetical protein